MKEGQESCILDNNNPLFKMRELMVNLIMIWRKMSTTINQINQEKIATHRGQQARGKDVSYIINTLA